MKKTVEIRLAVLGSTSWTDWDVLQKELDRVMNDHHVTTLVVTKQPGAPSLGKQYGQIYGLPVLEIGGKGESFADVEAELMSQCNLAIAFEKKGQRGFGVTRARSLRRLLRVVEPVERGSKGDDRRALAAEQAVVFADAESAA